MFPHISSSHDLAGAASVGTDAGANAAPPPTTAPGEAPVPDTSDWKLIVPVIAALCRAGAVHAHGGVGPVVCPLGVLEEPHVFALHSLAQSLDNHHESRKLVHSKQRPDAKIPQLG